MKAFRAKLFIDLAGVLSLIEEHWYSHTYPDQPMFEEKGRYSRSNLVQMYQEIRQGCEDVQLPVSGSLVNELLDALEQNSPDLDDLRRKSHELLSRIHDEANLRLFYSIPIDKQHLITSTKLFGDAVADAFPNASYDIEEASKCLALERYTACVFHLGRVAEIATVAIGQIAGYPDPKPSLHGVLTYLEEQIKKAREDYKQADALIKGNVDFYAEIVVHMHPINQAWRQRVAHMEKKYTEEEADRVYGAVKSLLQHIATRTTEVEDS